MRHAKLGLIAYIGSFALAGSWGCAAETRAPVSPCPTPAPSAAPLSAASAGTSGPTATSAQPNSPPPSTPATNGAAPTASSEAAEYTEVPEATPEVARERELELSASGPATGGPHGSRRCEFRESVDAYRRQCVISKNPDGSLQVSAKGTDLNPDNGFTFSMHGGPYNFTAKGELNAFDLCRGPFTAHVSTVIDNGVTTYELRFNKHCMIVIR